MDQKRYQKLKKQAQSLISTLRYMTGDGATIHARNILYSSLRYRLNRLASKGEQPMIQDGRSVGDYSLDGFEKRIREAEKWVKAHTVF